MNDALAQILLCHCISQYIGECHSESCESTHTPFFAATQCDIYPTTNVELHIGSILFCSANSRRKAANSPVAVSSPPKNAVQSPKLVPYRKKYIDSPRQPNLKLTTTQTLHWAPQRSGEYEKQLYPTAFDLTLIPLSDTSALAELVVSTTKDNKRYLSDSQFASIVQGAACNDSFVSLAFNDTNNLESARSQWSWVNQPGNSLYLFLDQPGCVEDEARQPYHVESISFTNSTAVLQITEINWTELGGAYRLGYSASPSRTTNQPRGFGDIDEDLGTVSIDFNHDITNTIISDADLGLELDCNPCSTFGEVDLHFEFSASNFGLFDQLATVPVTTRKQLGANITLDMAIAESLTNVVKGTYPIYKLDLSDLDSIPGIFEIGPVLRVQAYVEISEVEAKLNLSTGVDVTIDSASCVDFDLFNPDTYSTEGWTPSFYVKPPSTEGNASVTTNVGTEVILDLEAAVLSVGLAAGIVLTAPEISADLSVATDTAGGICNSTEGISGMNFDLGVGAGLDLFAGLNTDTSFDAASLPNKKAIFSTSTQLYSTCLTFETGRPSGTTSSPAATAYMAANTAYTPSSTG